VHLHFVVLAFHGSPLGGPLCAQPVTA
jgi:hypothetical protein